MSKIIDCVWFTNMTETIGIVVVKPEYGEEKAYIGVGKGKDNVTDTNIITQYGAPFPIEAARLLTGRK